MTFYYNADTEKIPEKAENGTYDAAFLSAAEYAALSDPSDLNVQVLENTTYSFLFNQRDIALADENLRMALCRSADVSSLIGEKETAATGLVPPYCKIGAGNYRAGGDAAMLKYDASTAKKRFDEAMLDLGTSSVEVEVLCTEEYSGAIRQIVQNWQRVLGVKFVATVKVLPLQQLQAAVQDGAYSIAFYPLVADSVHTAAFLDRFGGNNLLGFQSQAYADLQNRMRAKAGDFDALRVACNSAENYLIQHAVVLPVLYQGNCFVTSKDTEGIYFYSSKDYVYFIQATKK